MAGFVGEAVLSGFIQKLVDMVTSPELWKYARKEQVDSELKRWKNILIKIYVVLNDAEEKQMTNPLVKIWLDELRDLGYDVEDILDDFATEALRSSLIMAQPQQGTSKVRGMLSSLIPSASTSNSSMRSKIEEITARLQDISAQKNDLDLREIAGGWWSDRKRKRAQILPTTSLVVESDVYGRETDKAAIVDMLLKHDPSSDDEVSVIPIVGMGGIGKTTLAQLAFNEVKGRFDLRAWVCVSDDFDVSRITKTILQSVDPGTHDVNDLNLLQVKLKEKFSGKKFLLVLDDVWNENSHEWDTLCMPMRAGAPGSKLIVTTRNEGVAAVTRTCPAYPLRELSNNDCLSLFTQQALRTRNFDAHPHLKEVGEEIVRRCKGLPLAAKALGGMLRNQLSRDAWANILTSRIWELPEDKSHILPALMLSYHHLPSHLKQCFAYCSMFPKDYEFNKDDLVLLWMTEGFLQKTKEAARPEDLGSKYFDDLFSRSFFQHSSQDSSQYVMHDLINDLAQSVAGEIYFHLDGVWENNKQSTISEKTRHSSFNRQVYETQRKFEPFHKVKCLRTLVALPMNPVYDCNFISSKVLDDLLKEVKYLRVLSLSGYEIYELPDSIANLKYLRYLNLSCSSIRRLPDSVCHLYNLQALILSYCGKLTMLPVGIGNLINLRHLHISDTSKLQEMPSQIGNLTNLQTLSKFIVGEGNGLGIRELKNLFDLRGELSIFGLHNVMNIRDGRDAKLESKRGIEELTMEWSDYFGASRNEMHERHVLEQLRPHRNLKKLTIASYGGSEFPSWMKDPSFPIMTHLILKDCKRCTSLPALGQLSSLKVLHIKGMSEVRTINEEFYGGIVKPFPSLESLKFEEMEEWEYWFCPDAVNEGELFPCLRELTIRDCRKLRKQLPNCLPSQVKFGISSCPYLGFASSRFASLGEVNLVAHCEMVRISEVFGGLHAVMRWSDWLALLEEQRLPCNPKMLIIRDDANLEKLPNGLQTLTCLERLEIWRCPKLESFPETGLPPLLRRLVVSNCEGLKSLPHNYSSCALEFLLIFSCPSLRCFPNCELPTTLKHISIKNCENLESLPERMMHHDSTCCLEELNIKGCPRLESFPDTGLPQLLRRLVVINCEGLKSLPHNYSSCALESLEIRYCPSLRCFPNGKLPTTLKSVWIEHCENLESLPEGMMHHDSTCCLEKLKIKGCPRLESFPDTGLPPLLRRLVVSDCEGLKSLPHNYSSCALESLEIRYCSSLKSFSTRELPSTLKKLEICGCPDLESMSENMCPNNSALDNLVLERYPNLKILPECLHSLKSLRIINCEGLECFPARGLSTPTLTSLLIERCENLKSLPHQMRDLKSLRDLTISFCPGVESLPEDGMPPNLISLEISHCENLKKPILAFHTLTSLSSLTIENVLPDMVSFPDEECLLPISLTSLTITAMESLAYLSLQNLISLRSLNVKCCPNLRSLGSMPATLEKLQIRGCPILEERYSNEKGEYWPNIAHIPYIEINGDEYIH